MADEARVIEVRLTRAFINSALDVLKCISPQEAESAGHGDDYVTVRGFFENAAKTFKLRDEADRIEEALRRAR